MCIPFQTIEPPTSGTQKAVKLLQYIAIAELVVILLKLIVVEDFLAFFELIIIFILYSAWAQLNYCSCVFFVLFCLYQVLFIFVIFGTRVQDGDAFFSNSGSRQQAALVVEFLFFFYYIGAAYIAFLAYNVLIAENLKYLPMILCQVVVMQEEDCQLVMIMRIKQDNMHVNKFTLNIFKEQPNTSNQYNTQQAQAVQPQQQKFQPFVGKGQQIG